MYSKKKKLTIIISFLLVIVLLVVAMIFIIKAVNEDKPVDTNITVENETEVDNSSFDYKFIRKVNDNYNNNYLVSPLSVAYVLSMLKDGATGETKEEINNVINGYEFRDVVNIDNKISIANALFINTSFKNKINKEYISTIQNQYKGNILYDSFENADAVNSYISGKTFGLIPKAISSLSRNAQLYIINTIALDIEWKQKMYSDETHSGKFTKIDNTQIDVAYMSDENNFAYIENENAKGIVKHYKSYDIDTGNVATSESKNTIDLEYIAILPKTDINTYISNLDQYELSRLLSTVKVNSNELDLSMNIPKYTYDFTLDKFKTILTDLGIKKAFEENAELGVMAPGENLYVSDAIHKTYIDNGEEGTKAAAVSILTLKNEAIEVDQKEKIEITFNSPFIYIIKEKNSSNIWFFGITYEPTLWEDYQKLIDKAKEEAEKAKKK